MESLIVRAKRGVILIFFFKHRYLVLHPSIRGGCIGGGRQTGALYAKINQMRRLGKI